ncbi:glutamic acid-rich protein [Topomyia yanbarensis]|uniref:glutamic acid-rich protein n=1 Tax=Topomyia yanbarensis TaxID=2498891 RepID=UPI00273B25D7|nr:glutamic acid-rich protein [Topomyia yanbarensis]
MTGKICQSESDIMIDNDDEDDYEGYFLQPANEYNIKEKIKLANQESFAIPTPPSPKFGCGERRVTFRDQLVDYEPDECSDVEEDNGYSASNGILHEESDSSPELNDHAKSPNTSGDMTEVDEDIIEELSINEPTEEEIESRVETVRVDDDQVDEEEDQEDYEELEEEVTESSLDTEVPNPETASEDSSSPTKARASEEGSGSGDGPFEVNYSEDSQNDEDNSEERKILKERLMRESLSYDLDCETNEDGTEDQIDDENSLDRDSPVQAHFRNRSAKCQRKCCRFKKKIDDKLPYYNGFHSEYGLSKEELDAKNKRVEAKKKRFYERYQKKVEQQQIKAQTNEEAFAAWLNKKLRNSINKYQNMYDYKGKKHKQKLPKDDDSVGVLVS